MSNGSKVMRQLQIIVGVLAMAAGSAAMAVDVSSAWVRATPPGSSVSAGFLTISADPEQPDRLLGAKTVVASVTEIHESRMDGEMMRMRRLADGVAVAAGETVILKPGGIHLMLLQLQQPLVAGEGIELELQFERAGTVRVEAEVRAP